MSCEPWVCLPDGAVVHPSDTVLLLSDVNIKDDVTFQCPAGRGEPPVHVLSISKTAGGWGARCVAATPSSLCGPPGMFSVLLAMHMWLQRPQP